MPQDNTQNQKDTYFVAVKVFLMNEKGELLIIKDVYDDGWDIPGGRLRNMDFDIALEDVVKRKIEEEIGKNVDYKLGEPIVFFRHERDEVLPSGEKSRKRIFAVGYEAKYLGGEIELVESFKEYKWVDPATFVPEDYFVGGWLKGVKEYLEKIKINKK